MLLHVDISLILKLSFLRWFIKYLQVSKDIHKLPDLFIHVVLIQVLKKSLSNADTYRKLKKNQKTKPKYTICASYVQRFLIREIALLLKQTAHSYTHRKF